MYEKIKELLVEELSIKAEDITDVLQLVLQCKVGHSIPFPKKLL